MVNLKLALRSLTKSPVVTGVAVLSLALGIGANTAMFSLYDQLLRRPLPVREPEQLVNLGAPGPKAGATACTNEGSCEEVFSYPMFRDLERGQTVFTGIAAHVGFSANLGVPGQTPTNGTAIYVSGSYFPVLGVTPALGRLFTPQDDRSIGGHSIAVLSHPYWVSALGARASVLNETIYVNGQPMTIIGVAPRDFRGNRTMGVFPAVFVPLTMREVLSRGVPALEDRRAYWAYLFARLKPGVTMEQARERINATYRPIINDVEAPLQEGVSGTWLAEFRRREVTIQDGRHGQSRALHEATAPIVLLFGITGIVLFIACANIANLLLARATSRSMEMAVRLSLGATRKQLVTQLLTESFLLATLGGTLSMVLAKWTQGIVISSAPADAASFIAGMLNTPVLLFAASLSLATGLLFGLFPAMHSTRLDLITAIRGNTGQRSGARSAARFRTSLVTVQIALSMALLGAAGLFVKSLINVSRVDLGLETENVVTFRVQPELNGYETARSLALINRLQQELASAPGVMAVAASVIPLLNGSSMGGTVSVEGFEKDPDVESSASFNLVSAGYFRALGVPLLAGREFESADFSGAQKVAIVNEAFAKKFNLGRNAVGKFMSQSDGVDSKPDIQIVGLVGNAKYSAVKDEIPPLFFTPFTQNATVGSMYFYARTSGDPALLVREVPGLVARLDPNLPVQNLKTLAAQANDSIMADRLIGAISAAFAVLATLLAAIGLYGVMAYAVAQRTREIGVRMALGASGGRVRAMVLTQVARLTAVGAVMGVAGALAFGRAARSMLFGLGASDPVVIGGAVLLLTAVALAAGFVPAYRASRVHPMQALRWE
jgi:predicted permease